MKIKLLFAFTFDHCSIPPGTELDIADHIADQLIAQGAAAQLGYRRAVVQPEETREARAASEPATRSGGRRKKNGESDSVT